MCGSPSAHPGGLEKRRNWAVRWADLWGMLPIPAPPRAAALVLLASTSAQAAPAGLKLSLLGGYRAGVANMGRSVEWRTLLTLTVPLDRFATSGALAHPSDLDEPSNEGGANVESGDSAGRARLAGEASAVPTAVVLAPLLARKLVEAALRHAGHEAAEERFDELARRSRSSASLPELRLRGGRSVDQSLRLSPTNNDPFRYTQAGGAKLFFEARLTWDLDRLVFSSEELAVERLRRQRASDRLDLVERVLEALFSWQRAKLEAIDPTRLPEERALAQLRGAQAAILLDVLTGGWFSDHVSARRPPEPDAETRASEPPVTKP